MTGYTALHIVKLLWSWQFWMGSHYRHLSANAWSPVTESFKWGVHCQICQFLFTMSIHLPAIYMHCLRSSTGCSGMQGIYAQLTGEDLSPFYIYMWQFHIGGWHRYTRWTGRLSHQTSTLSYPCNSLLKGCDPCITQYQVQGEKVVIYPVVIKQLKSY